MRLFRLKHPRLGTYFLDQSKDSAVTSNQYLDQSAAWKVTSWDGDFSVLITLGYFNGLSDRRIFGPVLRLKYKVTADNFKYDANIIQFAIHSICE